MNSPVSLGQKETVSLIVVAVIAKLFYRNLPGTILQCGSAAVWIVLLSALLVFILSEAILRLLQQQEGKNLLEVAKGRVGRVGGLLFGIGFYLYFLLYVAGNVREAVRTIKVYNFPLTPTFWLVFCFLLAAVFVTLRGLYGVSKLSEFFLLFLLVGVAAVFLLGIEQYKLSNLRPYGGYGIASLREVLIQTTWWNDLFLLFLLVRSVGGTRSMKQAGRTALVWSGSAVVLSVLCFLLAFGYEQGAEKRGGLIEVVKNVYFSSFFQRMESVFFLLLVVSSAIAICVWFYLSVDVFSSLFQIQDRKALVPSHAIILCSLAMLPQSSSEPFSRLLLFLHQWGGVFVFGIPLLLWLIPGKRRTPHA